MKGLKKDEIKKEKKLRILIMSSNSYDQLKSKVNIIKFQLASWFVKFIDVEYKDEDVFDNTRFCDYQ